MTVDVKPSTPSPEVTSSRTRSAPTASSSSNSLRPNRRAEGTFRADGLHGGVQAPLEERAAVPPGDINFLLNMEASGQPADFRQVHGRRPTPCFRVKDAAKALKLAVERGATAVVGPVGPMELNIPAIEGSRLEPLSGRPLWGAGDLRRRLRPHPRRG